MVLAAAIKALSGEISMKRKNSGKITKMELKDITASSVIEDLRDPEFAVSFLEDVLSEGSTPAFLAAIRSVAAANGGMQKISRATKLGRESMYKALSKDGNPQFSTIALILKQLGLRFSIAHIERKRA